ncbi:MAG: low-specificity L-threonine aldolase, partial [Gammaproteobacteria bacterium]|nr:low-specificity L-threonine aldolase [Gammaproteobacteria bacterium]
MRTVDLRSDTTTLPTDEMRQAISGSELGDDVFQGDPTVNRLQDLAAQRMGKEAALLVPSGTMANLASILTHCGRGAEVILGNRAHTYKYEKGGISAYGGIHSTQIPNQDDGTMQLEDIRDAIRGIDDHFPVTKLICLENTHNVCGGAPLSVTYTKEVANLARAHNIKMHIDGARIFNAAVALGVDVQDLVEDADSMSFCMSKGLGAPVGSVICGSKDFIDQARGIRKGLGGGMRQAGIIAAAGIVALETMVDRLQEDHTNARLLADGIADLPGVVELLRSQAPVRAEHPVGQKVYIPVGDVDIRRAPLELA